MGFAEEIPGHAGDQKCFDFIKESLETCIRQHECGKDGASPLLPSRIIWIKANNASRIQLLEPRNIRAPYIALSYCWGPVGPNTYLTDAHTLHARKAGINFDDVPPLFQDVVRTARALGIEYIWIDRLCIIQGDDNDFQSQAPKMGEIFGNATLTIAAASATTEYDRILNPRDRKCGDLNMNVSGFGFLRLRFRRLSHSLGKERLGGDYGRMSTRAWIWQERLLATRTVFFTPTALKFECRCHSIWEGFEKGRTGPSWSSKLENMTLLNWKGLVVEYMRRDITRPSDRLPAMNAVMKRIEKSTGWYPIWGLWKNALAESMSWHAADPQQTGKYECRMNPGHYAPTWSWASVDGQIYYASTKPMGVEVDPMRWELECRSLIEASGLIRVAGRRIVFELHCRIERDKLREKSPAEPKFEYRYDVRGRKDKEGTILHPDVALKPWSVYNNGEHVSIAVRVPYGETPPTQSWTALCSCILLGGNQWASPVLALGYSLRVPNAWERIGMVTNLSPTMFSMSQKEVIEIV